MIPQGKRILARERRRCEDIKLNLHIAGKGKLKTFRLPTVCSCYSTKYIFDTLKDNWVQFPERTGVLFLVATCPEGSKAQPALYPTEMGTKSGAFT
jgi:hypothetical protein